MGKYSWFWEGDSIYAVVGVSHRKKKFGNALFKELKKRGFEAYAVSRGPGEIDGSHIYESLAALPKKPARVIVSVKPRGAKRIVEDCIDLRIKEIWFQQGSFTPELEELCRENRLRFVGGSCAFLYLIPAHFPHNLHVWLARLLGKY